MEPANILFVIAFIGIPVAFGIWALVSRRELKNMPPIERAAAPEDVESGAARPAPPSPPRQPARQPDSERTRPMPAAAEEPVPPPPPAPQPSQQPSPEPQATRPMPAADEPDQPVVEQPQPVPEPQATRPMPAAAEPNNPPPVRTTKPQPGPQPTHQMPAVTTLPPPPPPGQSYRSGTTEELPIVEMPDSPRPSPPSSTSIRPNQPTWEFQPMRIRLARLDPAPRRPFYPPRYAGKSGGAVKRLTPRAARSFLGPAVGLRRRS